MVQRVIKYLLWTASLVLLTIAVAFVVTIYLKVQLDITLVAVGVILEAVGAFLAQVLVESTRKEASSMQSLSKEERAVLDYIAQNPADPVESIGRALGIGSMKTAEVVGRLMNQGLVTRKSYATTINDTTAVRYFYIINRELLARR